tara:strand:+ start:9256 stop:9657 length:402 start_codon:yes stop_codon:yes gene_type:complete
MKCGRCKSEEMKNCFQAGKSDPICEKCFFDFSNKERVKIQIDYKTRKVYFDEVDKIHSDMIGKVGGNMLDVDVEDIAFNDDETATVIGSVKGVQLEGKNLEFLEEYACNTIEEADKSLHKFIQRLVRFKIIRE